MQTILEHGIIISFTDYQKYEKVKESLDTLSSQILNLFPNPKKKGLHGVTLRNKNLLLTCCLSKGKVRFGIYYAKEKELRRWCDVDVLYNLSDGTFLDLLNRLESSVAKKIELPPLNELWRLSIQKEIEFTDKNGLVELQDPEVLTVKIKQTEIQANPPITF